MPVLAVLTLLSLAPPLADDPAYTAGVALFEDFEYEKAVFRFQEALEVDDRSTADRATILIRLGMTWAELRRDDKATSRFKEALSLDPLVALPDDASPKIKTLLDHARRELREEQQAAQQSKKAVDDAPDVADAIEPAPQAAAQPPADNAPPAAAATAQAPDEEGGLPWLLIGGGAVVAVGVVGALAGGALWAGGVGLAQVGGSQTFQSDAVAYDLPARAAQLGGQVVLAVGVVALVGGGGLVLTSIVLE